MYTSVTGSPCDKCSGDDNVLGAYKQTFSCIDGI